MIRLWFVYIEQHVIVGATYSRSHETKTDKLSSSSISGNIKPSPTNRFGQTCILSRKSAIIRIKGRRCLYVNNHQSLLEFYVWGGPSEPKAWAFVYGVEEHPKPKATDIGTLFFPSRASELLCAWSIFTRVVRLQASALCSFDWDCDDFELFVWIFARLV